MKTPHISFYDSVEHHSKNADKIIGFYTLFLTLCFFAAVPFAVWFANDTDILGDLGRILTSPSKLVTDYFALGGLGSAFLNTAICGLIANAVIFFSKVRSNATTFAAYMLVIAHGFYGLNFLNMWTPLLGVLIYCIVMKTPFSEKVHVALFATALGRSRKPESNDSRCRSCRFVWYRCRIRRSRAFTRNDSNASWLQYV